MRFPDFYAAKREEVPSYIQAEYLRQQSEIQRADLERQRKVDQMNTLGQVNTGISDAMGEGESPIGSVLRAGKKAWANRGGQSPPGAAPQPGGSISRGPPPVSSALPGQSRGLPPGQRQLANPSAKADAVRKLTPTPQTPTPTPTPKTPTPVDPPMPGYGELPPGYGAQAATKGPTDAMVTSMIDKPMQGAGGNIAANMTAQVGNNAATGVAADAATKGLSAASSAVPVVGAATGAIPAALRGDTAGAVKGGVGGAASSTLMASAPALTAAGPVGWAGMAGLAALSLYGMLG
jgi:hypothetical protein